MEKVRALNLGLNELQELTQSRAKDLETRNATQTEKGFYGIFPKQITSNIEETSRENLDRLTQAFFQDSNASQYMEEAQELVNGIDEQLHITHLPYSIIAALQIGELISISEATRRGKHDPKTPTNSSVDIDGENGERDVVFFALAPKEKQNQSERCFGNRWGFIMNKKKLLDQAYFSPLIPSRGAERDDYRKMIFSGKHYPEFLKLSIAYWLRYKEQHDQDALKKFSQSLGDLISSFSTSYLQVEANCCPELKEKQTCFDIDFDEPVIPHLLKTLVKFHDDTHSSNNPGAPLEAFRYMPGLGKDTALLPYDGFWEVKVPVSVSLDAVEEIIIRPTDKETEAAITQYATRSGRKIEISHQSRPNENYPSMTCDYVHYRFLE